MAEKTPWQRLVICVDGHEYDDKGRKGTRNVLLMPGNTDLEFQATPIAATSTA